MPRDPGLEALIHADLPPDAYTEKAMFGGWAWLLGGNLLCGARQGSLLLRLGKDSDGWALALPGVAPMVMAKRTMSGWVRADPQAYGDDALRLRLLTAALDYVRSLPPK